MNVTPTTRFRFFAFTFALVVFPLASVTLASGKLAPFWFLAGDAFLYLGIAQASPGFSFLTFDGIQPTNGFHPFWQLWLWLLARAFSDPTALLWAALLSATALVILGVWALGDAIARVTGSWALALVVVPGVYFLLVGQALQNLSVWSLLDGMEGALVFALAGLLGRALVLWPRTEAAAQRHYLSFGMLLALLVFARLDQVFLVAGLVFAVMVWPGHFAFRQKLRVACLLSLPTAGVILAWLTWSLITTGLPVPVSGLAKSEGGLPGNLWVAVSALFPPVQDLRALFSDYVPDRLTLYDAAFRVVQLFVPGVFGLVWWIIVWQNSREKAWAIVTAGLALGVVLRAAYLFLFVNFWHQGYWYFAFEIAFLSLLPMLLLAQAWPSAVAKARSAPKAVAAFLSTLATLHAGLWSGQLLTEPRHAIKAAFWQDRTAIRTTLATLAPGAGLVEFGDGILNFALSPIPVRHGFVFAGDATSLAALRERRFLAQAQAEGFRLLSSYEYLRVPRGAERWADTDIRTFLKNSFLDARVKAELDAFSFSMVFVWYPDGEGWGIPFIRFTRRS